MLIGFANDLMRGEVTSTKMAATRCASRASNVTPTTRELGNSRHFGVTTVAFHQQHVKGDSETALNLAERLCLSAVVKNSANELEPH
jgi:hypothetical protein